MTKDDLNITFLMRNDPEVCKYAETAEQISWREHEAVFLYTDYPKYVFAIPCDEPTTCDNVIGFVDFRNDIINDNPLVKTWSFHLLSTVRGRGLSEIMLRKALEEAKKLGLTIILSCVKKNNSISNYLHKKLGFAVIKDQNETYLYQYVVI